MIVGYFMDYFKHEKPYCWTRPFSEPIELYRCESDHLLLSDAMLTKGYCAGHRLRQPTTPSLFELFLIYVGFIR